MTAPVLTREDGIVAAWAACMESFPTFLRLVMIAERRRDASGVPTDGAAVRYERWPHLMQAAEDWQAGGHEVVLKARQLGFSWLAAAYALWVALRQPGAVVLLISQTQPDAVELMRKVQFIYDHLRVDRWVIPATARCNTQDMEFIGGSAIRCVPSTSRGGRGFTATLVIVDEAAHHLFAQANWLAYAPTALDGGQILLISTANGPTGFFADRYRAAEAAPDGTFHARFIGALARPDRDEAWLERARASFEGIPAMFPQEYPLTPGDAFVQPTGLVYPEFSRDRHLVKPSSVPKWEECLYRYLSYDLGGGDPTAIGALGVWRGPNGYRAHLYAYYYRPRGMGPPDIAEMAAWMHQWHRADAPVVHVEADPKDAVVEQSFAALGLPTRTADWTRKTGLSTVASWLRDGWLSFPSSCPELIREFESYRWITRVDPHDRSKYETATPFDNHGDLLDTLRYALMGAYRDLMNQRDGFTKVFSGVKL